MMFQPKEGRNRTNNGGAKMARREYIILFVAGTLMFCFWGEAALQAQEPFASISVPDRIDLGNVTQYGQQTFNSTIKVHIIANCPNRIVTSIGGAFASPAGGFIPKERIAVETVPPLVSPTGTPPEGVDVDINLKFTIDIKSSDSAGEYTSTLVITIMAEP
jgi:hypothetical protein